MTVASSATTTQSLTEVVQAQMAKWTVPGIAVGIFNAGEELTHSFGVANLETEYETRTDTLFQIGSISKIFTTTLLMKLIDGGKVDLNAPVSRYLSDFKLTTSGTEDEVLIRHLLSHVSGVYGDHFEDFGWGDDALERYVASLSELRQVYEPGTIWSYTNSAFNLAGRIIEVVLDSTFESAVNEHIFKSLKMDRSCYFPHEAIVYPVSVGHTQVEPGGDEHQVARRWPIPRASGPAGSISSTTHDMLKFARYHLGDASVADRTILSEESRQAMQEIEVPRAGLADSWGLGWQINFIDGTKIIGHGGSTNGFQAHLDLVPDQQFAIVILTNSGRGAAAYRAIRRWALEHYCDLVEQDPVPITIPAEQLDEYAGTYSQPLADISVTVEQDRLQLDVVAKSALADDEEDRRQPPVHLQPISEDRFIISNGASAGSITDFIRNPDNSIRFIRYGGRVSDRDR